VSSSRQAPEQGGQVPVDPAPRPTRRTFTTEYKAGVVAEYEAAKHGEKSAVLRREGLFHSRRIQAVGSAGLALLDQDTPGQAEAWTRPPETKRTSRHSWHPRWRTGRYSPTSGHSADHWRAPLPETPMLSSSLGSPFGQLQLAVGAVGLGRGQEFGAELGEVCVAVGEVGFGHVVAFVAVYTDVLDGEAG
jgi:hypothetical protein